MAEYPTETSGVTHPDRHEGPAEARNRCLAYAAGVAVLIAILVSAVVDAASQIDIWGVSSDWVADAGAGYDLEVRYPTVTRPALATPFEIVVGRKTGFDRPVKIAVEPNWLEMWDYQSFYPTPSESTADRDSVLFTFQPPRGDVLRVFFDARIQPAPAAGP